MFQGEIFRYKFNVWVILIEMENVIDGKDLFKV